MTYILIQNRNCGFFSDFNTIVGSLHHFKTNNINFYCSWNNVHYQETNYNMFDKYFFIQDYSKIDENKTYCTAVDTGFPYIVDAENRIKINNDRSGFQSLHKTLKHFNYFENVFYKKCKNEIKIKPRTLGVHVRQTDHWRHGPVLPCEYYFEKIDEKIQEYDYVFLATDELRIVNEFQKKYGNKLYLNEKVIRSDNHEPIHIDKYPQYKEKLAEDVFLDVLTLSLCDEIIITTSNISHYIFIINPDIKYYKIDKHIFYQ